MSKDLRMSFIKRLEEALSGVLPADQVNMVSVVAIKALEGYEVTERCTEIEVYDDTNDQLVKRYRGCLLLDGRSDKTVSMYIFALKNLATYIGKPFTKMGTYDLRFFLAKKKDENVSNRTLENYRAYLSAFFKWLTDEDLIHKNPMSTVKPIKFADTVKKPFSDTEIDAMRSACQNMKERAMMELLLSTGVRMSELVSMRIRDIDMQSLTVHVVHGKGAKERTTYTTPVSVKYLQLYIDGRKETGEYLFYNKNHEKMGPSGVRYLIHAIAERAGVSDAHPHRFRRTFATNLAKRGMDIQEIQKILGHSDINTTMVYVRMNDANIHNSYRKFIA